MPRIPRVHCKQRAYTHEVLILPVSCAMLLQVGSHEVLLDDALALRDLAE